MVSGAISDLFQMEIVDQVYAWNVSNEKFYKGDEVRKKNTLKQWEWRQWSILGKVWWWWKPNWLKNKLILPDCTAPYCSF